MPGFRTALQPTVEPLRTEAESMTDEPREAFRRDVQARVEQIEADNGIARH